MPVAPDIPDPTDAGSQPTMENETRLAPSVEEVRPNYKPGAPVPGGSTYVGKGAPPPDKSLTR